MAKIVSCLQMISPSSALVEGQQPSNHPEFSFLSPLVWSGSDLCTAGLGLLRNMCLGSSGSPSTSASQLEVLLHP